MIIGNKKQNLSILNRVCRLHSKTEKDEIELIISTQYDDREVQIHSIQQVNDDTNENWRDDCTIYSIRWQPL